MDKVFKRSIWDEKYEYKIIRDTLTEDELKVISIIQTIESAKKRTPSIPMESMLALHSACKDLEKNPGISVGEFEKFIKKVDCLGAGYKTIICILAVLTKGLFPPLDIKIAGAARIKGYISDEEEKDVNGASLSKMSKIYIEKITPKWREELSSCNSAQELDEAWGRLYDNS